MSKNSKNEEIVKGSGIPVKQISRNNLKQENIAEASSEREMEVFFTYSYRI